MTNKPSVFVATIDLSLAKKLQQELVEQGFELSQPQYTVFSGKKKGINCTLFQSGKVVIQGAQKEEFIEFFFEPQYLMSQQSYSFQKEQHISHAHIGVDESGKGDFFGPLCIAGVYAGPEHGDHLRRIGVKDSKQIDDKKILVISDAIRKDFPHHIVRINPHKYNELYGKFRNLNLLLAWGHATVIENLTTLTSCHEVLIDQFADEKVVINALKRKGLKLNLTQRHRGEEDLAVAAASILARAAFLEGLYKLRKDYDIEFPKGASAAVIAAGKKFVSRKGAEALSHVGKLHFKTAAQILG